MTYLLPLVLALRWRRRVIALLHSGSAVLVHLRTLVPSSRRSRIVRLLRVLRLLSIYNIVKGVSSWLEDKRSRGSCAGSLFVAGNGRRADFGDEHPGGMASGRQADSHCWLYAILRMRVGQASGKEKPSLIILDRRGGAAEQLGDPSSPLNAADHTPRL